MTGLLLVVLGALAGAWANNYLTVQHEKKQWRFDVLKRCMANRRDVTGEAFSTALNEAILVYASDKKVVAAIRELRTGSTNARVEALLRAMAHSCGVRQSDLTSDDFLIIFNKRELPRSDT